MIKRIIQLCLLCTIFLSPLLGSSSKEIVLRKQIISTAEDYLGATGFSSSQLINTVFIKNNIPVKKDASALFKQGTRVNPKQARAGDLIFFSFANNGRPDHVAIYLGRNRFIHAYKPHLSVKISHLNRSNQWGKHFLSIRSYSQIFTYYGKKTTASAASLKDIGTQAGDGTSAKLSHIVLSSTTDDHKLPSSEKSLRKSLIKEAKKFIGLPYRYGGSTPKGFDCSGFIQYLYKKQGISLPRSSRSQYSSGKKIHPSKALPGDLIFFYGEVRGRVSHVVMYMGGGKFIHSPRTGRVISISTIKKEKYWGKRYVGVVRYIQ